MLEIVKKSFIVCFTLFLSVFCFSRFSKISYAQTTNDPSGYTSTYSAEYSGRGGILDTIGNIITAPFKAIWEVGKFAFGMITNPSETVGNLVRSVFERLVYTVHWAIFGEPVEITETQVESYFGNPAMANVYKALYPRTEDGKIILFQGGMLQVASSAVAGFYAVPPASGVHYIADVMKHFGVNSAFAANGAGFEGLKPLLPIWQTFRNVVYVLFTIIFIVVGLMIMLRVKISPQAVVTLENALPKMVGALILVTFSYAIAGLMIDLMYVVMSLGISTIIGGGAMYSFFGANASLASARMIIQSGFLSLQMPLIIGFQGASLFGLAVGAMMGFGIGAQVPIPGLNLGLQGALGAVLGIIGFILFLIVWGIIALFLFFKLILKLLGVYFNIIMSIIFAPFQIMIGAFPNSPHGFGTWLKGLAANLAVFPAISFLSIIAVYIIGQAGRLESLWIPPLLGPPTEGYMSMANLGSIAPGVYGGVAAIFVKAAVGMGMLLLLPKVPDIVRGAMGVKDTGLGGAIGEGLGPAKTIGKLGANIGGGAVAERVTGDWGDRSWWKRATRGFLERQKIVRQR